MKKDLFNLDQEKYTVKNSRSYVVIPQLPKALKPLFNIAYNLWWIWNSDAIELFRRIDRELWEKSYHNPIKMLGLVEQNRLTELAKDSSFMSHLERVSAELEHYIKSSTWFDNAFPQNKKNIIAYFSTEFGIHESLPIYSGGLGILSGDHLKSASDMGLPLVGMGLLYRYGYFSQYLNIDGWQQEEYIQNHFLRMPIERVQNDDGKQIIISVDLPSGPIYAQIWKIQVGRVSLYLLDTDIDKNTLENREITGQLYGGDRDMRIRQEILLGIGGIKALKALNIEPAVFHLNEGHSAFLAIELITNLMHEKKLSFAEALEVTKASCVFTTHTPIAAGNEVFNTSLIDKYFEQHYKKLGLKKDEFMALGRINPKDETENFCMTVLALKTTSHANGVSKLHGTISRNMWKDIWPNFAQSDIPITHITNGVHPNTWISYEMAELFNRYMGSTWKDEPADQTIWQGVKNIPDAELWRSHERRRERLVSFARTRLKEQLIRRGASISEINAADEVLDPDALIISFARRFTSYKRGTLIFSDFDRLKKMLTNKNRPIQLIIAGKAHPHDSSGKEFIRQIIHICRDQEVRNRIVFIEDYDANVAHYLVQGSDVWLNNPRRPFEASGTSGMKAAVNGVLNLSVLDGWWCEGYNGENGWIIGSGEEYANQEYQDEVESKAIYDLLEKEIIHEFYLRGSDGLPRLWINKMKKSMMTINPIFNTNRMIEDYTRKFYTPAIEQHFKFVNNNYAVTKSYTQWKNNVSTNWDQIKISEVQDNLTQDIEIGKDFSVKAKISLGQLSVDDVYIELYFGYLDSKNRMQSMIESEMKLSENLPSNTCIFEGVVKGDRIGHCGYVIRILPKFENKKVYIPNLILWQ
ncbi:MAG: alpha-glucan family phosphorylase [Endomicrobiales bacterium]|nr:alpha-glucan family phosphorylase [Endomicrobiales bacterium]